MVYTGRLSLIHFNDLKVFLLPHFTTMALQCVFYCKVKTLGYSKV